MSRKIGFWSVLALVTGSQIGTGVFMLPASLARYGGYSLWGWVLSGTGAVALALIFAHLCSKFPKTGGPHVYVNEAFGSTAAFFTGWTYWVISWISTTAVIVASIGYLTPLIGTHSPPLLLSFEIILLLFITALNLKGVKTAGRAEFFLTLLKIIPLVIMPLAAIFFFDKGNFVVDSSVAQLPISQVLSSVALLTLWGFIGVESGTTPAGCVENPSKTIPKAIVLGTTCVAFLYIGNSLSIMGIIPGQELMHSKAPYVDAARILFGGNWYLALSIIASIVCIGCLNAWTLTSGQISLGLAQDGLMPQIFSVKNKNEAPVWSLVISCLGITPLLVLTAHENLGKQITMIVDFSVTAFLFVYLACSLGFLKLLIETPEKKSVKDWIYGLVATLFCCWVIYETSLTTLMIASLFTLSGFPVYLYLTFKAKKIKYAS